MCGIFCARAGPKLVPQTAAELMQQSGCQGLDAMSVAMMTPLSETLFLGRCAQVGPSAVELLQQAATEPERAARCINEMAGSERCNATSVQAEAMKLTMRQAYAFATTLANTLGYHSLEQYELHKISLVKASSLKSKKGDSKKLSVFVGGLKKDIDDEQLRAHFSQFGGVTRADVIRNQDGTSRGFGFVKFVAEEDVEKCMRAKFEHILDGQWVNVKVSDPSRADSSKNASKVVEMAARSAGVEPSRYLDFLTEVATAKYGYQSHDNNLEAKASRCSPY